MYPIPPLLSLPFPLPFCHTPIFIPIYFFSLQSFLFLFPLSLLLPLSHTYIISSRRHIYLLFRFHLSKCEPQKTPHTVSVWFYAGFSSGIGGLGCGFIVRFCGRRWMCNDFSTSQFEEVELIIHFGEYWCCVPFAVDEMSYVHRWISRFRLRYVVTDNLGIFPFRQVKMSKTLQFTTWHLLFSRISLFFEDETDDHWYHLIDTYWDIFFSCNGLRGGIALTWSNATASQIFKRP